MYDRAGIRMGEAQMIPLSIPNFIGNESKYVMDALNAGWVSTAGSYVNSFEKSVAAFVKAKGAVACQSGTAGLHVALMLMGVTSSDAVIVPALTFIAAVNPVAYIGAEPIFMDCDDSLCMDPAKVRTFCEQECHMDSDRLIENATGRHVKALTVVHVFGNMADMEALMDIAAEFHLCVVEDATEALGTYYTAGRYAGKFAGTIGNVGVYSFNGNKIITTGGGGMIVSEDEQLLRHARHLTTQAKADELNFIHDEVGYNYRLTNLQAALGLAQMEELPGFIQVKQKNYAAYAEGVKHIPGLRLLEFREGVNSNHWFYALYLEDRYPLKRDALIQKLAEMSIQTRPIWGLICDQKPYRMARAYKVTQARIYHEHVINVPCSTNLTSEEVEQVLAALKG